MTNISQNNGAPTAFTLMVAHAMHELFSVEYYPEFMRNMDFTVAFAEYVCTRTNKNKHRFRLHLVHDGRWIGVSPKLKISEVEIRQKLLVAFGLENGYFTPNSENESRLASELLAWRRDPKNANKTPPLERGIINRFQLVMKAYPNEQWEEALTRCVRLTVLVDGEVRSKKMCHLKWQADLEDVVRLCAADVGCSLNLVSFQMKLNGQLKQSPKLHLQIGEIEWEKASLNVEIAFSTAEHSDPPSYSRF